MTEEIALALADVAASTEPLAARAEALLVALQRTVPFDGAWVALADPMGCGYSSLASIALDDRTLAHLSGPVMAHDIEVAGTDRVRPPMSPSDLPFPADVLQTWAECLIPAGFHEALGVELFGPGHRQIGHLTVYSGDRTPPTDVTRGRLDALTPILAEGVDPMRSAVATARLVEHAVAGVIVAGDRALIRLPGFVDDPLLVPGSLLLDAARRAVHDERPFATFLWPGGPERAHRGFVRVTTVAGPDELTSGSTCVVLLSPAGPLRGLTARELEVLGLVIDGCSNAEIANELVVAPRTVAAHLEHILVKLDAPSRTLAAVRAGRLGLYVPPAPHDR